MDIKQARKALGLTQAELGSQLGIDHSVVSKMEGGTVPIGPRTALAIEALLNRAGKAAA